MPVTILDKLQRSVDGQPVIDGTDIDGEIPVDNIPNLNASKINAGELAANRLPNMARVMGNVAKPANPSETTTYKIQIDTGGNVTLVVSPFELTHNESPLLQGGNQSVNFALAGAGDYKAWAFLPSTGGQAVGWGLFTTASNYGATINSEQKLDNGGGVNSGLLMALADVTVAANHSSPTLSLSYVTTHSNPPPTQITIVKYS